MSTCYDWFSAMHTRIDLLLCSSDSRQLQDVIDEIKNEISRIESFANRFDSRSELSIINKKASLQPISISPELYQIINQCLHFHQQTMGYFDITVNSFNNFKTETSNIELNPTDHTIYYTHPDVQIDLSGYIKGYALYQIKNILLQHRIADALISLGNSSILALGNHPNGVGWKIGSVILTNECLTSSGNSVDHLHIIDPETRKTASVNHTVSVITEDPIVGEVLSTTFCLVDSEQREILLERFGGKLVY